MNGFPRSPKVFRDLECGAGPNNEIHRNFLKDLAGFSTAADDAAAGVTASRAAARLDRSATGDSSSIASTSSPQKKSVAAGGGAGAGGAQGNLSNTPPPGMDEFLHFAPEVIRGGEYTQAADVWGVGFVMYILCFLKKPFTIPRSAKTQAEKNEYLRKVVDPKSGLPSLACLPEDYIFFQPLLEKLITKDPRRRGDLEWLLRSEKSLLHATAKQVTV